MLTRKCGSGYRRPALQAQVQTAVPPKKKPKLHVGMAPMAHACNPSYLGGWDWEDRGSRPAPANNLRDPPIFKITTAKWTRGVAQVVESLLCTYEALSSNSSPTKNHLNAIYSNRQTSTLNTTIKRKLSSQNSPDATALYLFPCHRKQATWLKLCLSAISRTMAKYL
jgi:hypothetical protein